MRSVLFMLSLVLAGLAGTARAERVLGLDPDTEVAQRHFAAGATAYSEGAYELALAEFSEAKKLHTSPELEYDIARTYDRMGRWKQAAEAYRHFIELAPNSVEAPQVRARIHALDARVAEERASLLVEGARVHVPSRPLYKKGWFWAVLGVSAAVVGVGVGLGVGFGAQRDPVPTLGHLGP